MEHWESKAHKLIAQLARTEYDRVNKLPTGHYRKRHRPYRLPVLAQELVECLGKRDEARAKAIFLDYDYLIQV